ncbi:lipoprotein-anchoring transpeptidase ErfK/SrfK [Sphingomonas sp. SORGH_AS 950]|uniref:L,D-transpeptidase family protein n=1 Tax=Sphingomonas sp. SORGH_AS_0950 TaxID=3041792 RepID=UPI002786AEBF|nr:L,D-transpeptidase family protein [Sphingomonas sp. SORGH_AS_0950]MDQ1156324.1 lipoprotein-anchoring transpeptidase ErfK/SrfK [Sphingomonas sp. SORGH_AS_0950]
MRPMQLLAGAILIGALGGGVMLIRHSADADATRSKVAAAPQTAATRPPAPSPSPSPSPAPFVVRRILDLKAPLHHGDFVWDESGAPQGPVVITVDLAAQVVSIFRDGYEIGTAAIIYGADNMPTPLGVFPILEKDADHVSNLYDAPMPYMLRLTRDGVAIHGSDVRYGYATHGCVGVPTAFARKLFAATRIGDRVIVTNGKRLAMGQSIVG